jgi:hypothetical protein
MSEKSMLERMSSGEWYGEKPDAELSEAFWRGKDLAWEFNQTRPSNRIRGREILRELLGRFGDGSNILAPLYVDYGANVLLGDRCFINHDAYFMDCAPIFIGNDAFIGPHFKAYTAQHPLDAEERNSRIERALPITVGDSCWFGGNVTVLGGVTIGDGCVIGANSLVTKDIPAGSLAMGSPAQPVRKITEKDRVGLKGLFGLE